LIHSSRNRLNRSSDDYDDAEVIAPLPIRERFKTRFLAVLQTGTNTHCDVLVERPTKLCSADYDGDGKKLASPFSAAAPAELQHHPQFTIKRKRKFIVATGCRRVS